MSNTITTDEWHPSDLKKPWAKRTVLVRLNDGEYDVAYWNGMYWCTQGGRPYHNDGADITHFYIFERYMPSVEEDKQRPPRSLTMPTFAPPTR